jgi:hypothetical protein
MPQAGYKHLEVSVSFTYTVLPIIHWHRKMVLGYKMVIATDGTRHWIEDDAAIKNIPNLRRGEKPTHPKDYVIKVTYAKSQASLTPSIEFP